MASQKMKKERLQHIINSRVIPMPKRDQGRRLTIRPPDMQEVVL